MWESPKEEEILVKAPWGNIALVTWGHASMPPVLMVHGGKDSSATFIPLVKHLPDNFYYVAIDLPGNGKSDSFSKGLPITRLDLVAAVDWVIRHMGWRRFLYIGHSMGCEVGLLYNAVCPGLVSGFILLDPIPAFQRLHLLEPEQYFKHNYQRYFDSYRRFNGEGNGRVYTRKQALQAIMKARDFTEEQAQTVLPRSMIEVGEDVYRLSWDPRVNYVATIYVNIDFYTELFSDIPPSFFVSMTDGSAGYTRGKDGAVELYKKLVSAGDVVEIVLEGGHDHHVTNPREIAESVSSYLNRRHRVLSKI